MANIDIPQKRVENLETTLSNKQDKLPNGTTGYFLQKTSDGVTWAEAGGSSMGKSIGEVYYSQSSSAQDNPGGLPLFTGETIANADQVYPDFYTWVANHSDLQISTANYETALTTYGECPKYVIDTTNKTIRLPKLANYVKMANTTDGITQSGAGLPNITGRFGRCVGTDAATGAFQRDGATTNNIGDSGSTNTWVTFDASRSSAIYGASNTVTPANTTLYPWVCAYSGAIPASVAQASEFQQALTGKADTNLSNVTGTSGFRKLVEVYSNGTSWYKVYDEYNPITGAFIGKWCEQGGVSSNVGYEDITLLKTYRDTNGTVIVTPATTVMPTSGAGNPIGGFLNASTIRVSASNSYSPAYWVTFGYLA